MYNLLISLENLLKSEFIGDGKFIQSVRIMSDFESETLLQARSIPCIIINPIGEEDIIGIAGNSKIVVMTIKIRVITRSTDPNKYRIGDETNNIYALTQDIKNVLYKNKMLNDNVFGFRSRFSVKDMDILFGEQAGHFSARDIYVEYEKLESWVGMHNYQKSSALPDGIIF